MDAAKLIPLIRNAVESKSNKHAKLIHQKVITSGLQNNIAICKNLISLFFSCQLFQSASIVFHSIEYPSDITLWNSLISNYTKNFMFNEALQVFEKLMHFTFSKPDSYTYPSLLKACSGLKFVNFGRMIHTHLVKSGFMSDVVVTSSLLGMYAKCGVFGLAVQVFDEMPERDVACWNAAVSCYHQDGQYEKALDLFGKMKDHGYEPDSVSFTTAISACAKLMNLERGREIHTEAVRNGFESDGFVQAAAIDMYGKCGCLEMAVQVFEQIPFKSLVSWNSMIAGYSLKGDSKSCIQLLSRMNVEGRTKPNSTTLSSSLMACSKSANLKHGKFIHGYIIRNNLKADAFIYSSLLDLYFKCGHAQSAESIFKKMPKTNVVEWNLMISGYVAVGLYLEALETYNAMNAAGVAPDGITFTSILAACTQLGALEKGKDIHRSIVSGEFESNEIVMGALLDMYTKCGAIDEAQDVFSRLPERDLISWTSMITAYGAHGQASKALKLFQEMQGLKIKPDRVLFLAVISTCSHAGLVNEGCYYFNQMVHDYGIQPKVADYSCLVDLLGRAGRLHDAYDILRRTVSIREDVELLSTLFSACYLHGDLELGEEIASLIIDKDPDDPSTYIVMANMYASIKKWDEARKVRLKMKELGLRKNPGCAWIEIDKKIEAFFVEDKSIPKAGMVYECLSILGGHMNKDEQFQTKDEGSYENRS
ncbi:pentatricopeptide repeat-containing protein At5g27110 [Cynara cardunculus var. scolymus]|uniref:pentatricopeptide repeat-containing protein At5g27110 n=1 Tax=Cynara cardunculus var. scolymus TaxID=59895 RepID=UPI000D62EDF9|nr:pentatricopeptide repeat-containing protein At5g27110 [Cynara cardunculus var. scolymus]